VRAQHHLVLRDRWAKLRVQLQFEFSLLLTGPIRPQHRCKSLAARKNTRPRLSHNTTRKRHRPRIPVGSARAENTTRAQEKVMEWVELAMASVSVLAVVLGWGA